MSATIVQKSSNPHYFECVDMFPATTTAVANNNNNSSSNAGVGNGIDQLQQQQQQQAEHHGLDVNGSLSLMEKEQLQQQHQAYRLHGALTRTISQPAQCRPLIMPQSQLMELEKKQPVQVQAAAVQTPQSPQQVASLVTIIENLGSMNLRRKLERTQSEPLPQQPMNTSRYKTELCRPYEEAGECKYGEKCQFAHGYHELRNLQRHPKYKTEYCRTFHSVGFCPYGPRCHFVHNADEARALQQQQQAQAQAQAQAQQQKQQQTANFINNVSNKQQLNNNNNNNNNNSTSNNNNNNNSQPPVAAGMNHYILPLSPPLSMSTGSDRESPTGSLSLSPTNSLTNFTFHEAMQQPPQPTVNGSSSNAAQFSLSSYVQLSLANSLNTTPPESPNAPISPVNTPPPYMGKPLEFSQSMLLEGAAAANKQLLQKSASTPLHHGGGGGGGSAGGGSASEEAPRLPVFNRLSSTVEAYQQSNLGL